MGAGANGGMRAMWRVAGPLAVFAGLAGWLHRAIWPRVVDQDGFYHLKHAWVYRTHGLFESAFPWAQFSAIRREAADLWYGFHLLLLPFTGGDLLTGVRVGAFAVTVAALLLVHAAFARLGIRRPLAWTLLFAFVSTDMLFRLLMLRPHPLSLGLIVLLFALLVRGGSTAAIAVVSGLVAWLHLALAWIPLLVVAVAVALHGRRVAWRGIAGVGAGLLVGLLARPNPLGAARLAWVQVGKLMAVKDLPLRFGVEILPFGWADFTRELIPISALLVLGVALLVRGGLPRETRSAALASLVLALVFLGLTFTTARRACELFVVFAVAFLGLVWTAERPGRPWTVVAAAILLWAAVTTPARFRDYANAGTFPDDVAEVGGWLRAHARPGELVFHVQWEKFAELFFQDERLRYVNGMDPIFAYDYDPALYWKHHHLADGGAATTCGALLCTPANAEDTHRVLSEDFGAAYVLVDRYKFPALSAYLTATPGFEKVYETRGAHLVRLADGERAAIQRGDTLFRINRISPRP